MTQRHVIADPLYGPIHLDEVIRALINTPEYQRLRRIKQLSTASYVYPGATHTRFEHAVGAYHLSKTILRTLADRGELAGLSPQDVHLIEIANCLHDIAHHGGSAHGLESAGVPGACHEAAAERFFTTGALGAVLRDVGGEDFGRTVAQLVRHESTHPLQPLVSGDCDPDKMDYLRRDAYHCGLTVGYDQAWLQSGLCVVTDPATGARTVGLDAAVLTTYEQMLYAKNLMYRTVYFHPVVVAAATMLRSLVVTALEAGLVEMEELQEWTDEEVVMALRLRVDRRRKETEFTRHIDDVLARLHERRLYTEVATLPGTVAPVVQHGTLMAVERELATLLDMAPGRVLLDVPHKPSMLSTDVLVRYADGTVRHAATLGPDDGFTITVTRDALMAAAARIRLYAATPFAITPARFQAVLAEAVARVGDPGIAV